MFLAYSAIFILTLVFGLDWLHRQTRCRKLLDKVPGPPAFPLLGNLPLVMFLDPEGMFKFARKYIKLYGPIFRGWLGPIATLHLSSPEEIEAVISSTKHIAKASVYDFVQDWLGTGLLLSNGAKWHERRKLLTPAFHFSVLKQFLGIFAEQTSNLVKRLGSECDHPYTHLNRLISNFTLNTVCETAMGTRLVSGERNQEVYREAVEEMGELEFHRLLRPWFHLDLPYMLSPSYWRGKQLIKVLHGFSGSIIRRREENFDLSSFKIERDEEDAYAGRHRLAMLDLLLKAKMEGGQIDDEGIREEVDTFMFEGHDTTQLSLCCTLMLIASHPEIQEKIMEELDQVFGGDPDSFPTYADLQKLSYLEMCIKESLRLYPSVPIIGRVSSEEFTSASGFVIPKGVMIGIHIFDVHRDPKIYPEPEKFVPERFLPENCKGRHPYAYLPFSAGPRNCIGQRFAMMELKTVVSGILRKFKLEAVDKPSDVALKYHIILKTVKDIRVKFRPRK